MGELIKRKRCVKMLNQIFYVRTYVGESPDATKNSEKFTYRKKPIRDKLRNEIMGEFSHLGKYRVY